MTRLGLLNMGLRHIARPFLRATKTPARARRDFALAARLIFRRPRGMVYETLSIDGPGGPMTQARITAGPVRGDAAILYFHGGGYVAGSPFTHRGMLARLSQLAGVPVVAPDYRLAPADAAPAQFEDACAAWRALRESGLAADGIVLAGDSAGGGLALALLAWLGQGGERPAGLVALSPWCDLTLTGQSLATNAGRDVLLPRERMEELVAEVVQGGDPADPRVSPLFADWNAPPPVYFQVSETEILLDDTRRMAERLHAAGGEVTVDTWPDAPHVWHLFDGWIPEARDALARCAEFARGRLTAARPQDEN